MIQLPKTKIAPRVSAMIGRILKEMLATTYSVPGKMFGSFVVSLLFETPQMQIDPWIVLEEPRRQLFDSL